MGVGRKAITPSERWNLNVDALLVMDIQDGIFKTALCCCKVSALLLDVDPLFDEPSSLFSVDPLAYMNAEAGKTNKVTIISNNKLVI